MTGRSTSLAARAIARLWYPTPATLRLLALASVVANAVIIVSGAAVRLSQSGLGCPTWPDCQAGSLIPKHDAGHSPLNQAIEFTNRQITFLVFAIGVLVFIAAARSYSQRRRDVFWLAAFQPASVLLQAIMGGITVLTKLNPVAVSAHFLLSSVLLGATVWLWVRTREGDDAPRRLVRRELQVAAQVLVPLVFVLLAAGTVVTGTGPNAGDRHARRYAFSIVDVAQLHVDIVWAVVGLSFAIWFGAYLTGAAKVVRRRALELIGVLAGQAVVGYIQYFTGVPPWLVGIHVTGSALVWIAALRVLFAMRDRGAVPATAALVSAEPAGRAAPVAT